MKEVTGYKVGERVFATIEEAQKQELATLFAGDNLAHNEQSETFADAVVSHTDEVVAILTCQPKSTPRKPRSDIGKKRAAKDATPAVL